MKNRQTLLVALPALLALGSCIGYEEELWVQRDGSGRVHSRVILSKMLVAILKNRNQSSDLEGALADRFKGIDGLRVGEARTYRKSGRLILSIKVDFDSWKRLTGIQRGEEEGAADFWGVASLGQDEEGRLVFTRTVQMGNADPEEENPFGAGLIQAMFSGYSWKYTVHFPAAVVSANAAEEDIDMESNTVTWEVGLPTVFREPYTMTATLDPGGGYLAYLPVGLVVVGLIGLVAWRMKGRK